MKKLWMLVLASFLFSVSLTAFATETSAEPRAKECVKQCLLDYVNDTRDECPKQTSSQKESVQTQRCLDDEQIAIEQCKQYCARDGDETIE